MSGQLLEIDSDEEHDSSRDEEKDLETAAPDGEYATPGGPATDDVPESKLSEEEYTVTPQHPLLQQQQPPLQQQQPGWMYPQNEIEREFQLDLAVAIIDHDPRYAMNKAMEKARQYMKKCIDKNEELKMPSNLKVKNAAEMTEFGPRAILQVKKNLLADKKAAKKARKKKRKQEKKEKKLMEVCIFCICLLCMIMCV